MKQPQKLQSSNVLKLTIPRNMLQKQQKSCRKPNTTSDSENVAETAKNVAELSGKGQTDENVAETTEFVAEFSGEGRTDEKVAETAKNVAESAGPACERSKGPLRV